MPDAIVLVDGVVGTAIAGLLIVNIPVSVSVLGVSAQSFLGSVDAFAWNPVNDTQADSWTPVIDSQAGGWTPVNDAQPPSWSVINT
jgi:hypothetical protein